VWIHENAELAGMKKADVEIVKSFASRQVDRARPAYGRFLQPQPRHGIEVGTTNSDEYLQSDTGNRRFWPLKLIKSIDIEKLRRDRFLLWGEAARYERDGESIVLNEKLWVVAAEVQEKRRIKDPWEDILSDLATDGFAKEYVCTEDGEERVKSSDLLTYVLRIPEAQQHKGHSMRLVKPMLVNGWLRKNGNKITINGKQVRGYYRTVMTRCSDET
jgi:predicted P-loop ATPase